MKITFLGSGSAFADFSVNYNNNALIETEEGPVLLDCGFTAVQSLKELGYSVHDLRAVLFTHVHPDHASPGNLLLERFFTSAPGNRSTSLIAPDGVLHELRTTILPFVGIHSNHEGRVVSTGLDTLAHYFAKREIEIGGVKFQWFPVPHIEGNGVTKPAFGIIMDDGKARVIWSGDTMFRQDWVEDMMGDSSVDHLFHECSFSPPFLGTVHTHYEELKDLSDDIAKRTTFMHYAHIPDDLDLSRWAGAAKRHQVFAF